MQLPNRLGRPPPHTRFFEQMKVKSTSLPSFYQGKGPNKGAPPFFKRATTSLYRALKNAILQAFLIKKSNLQDGGTEKLTDIESRTIGNFPDNWGQGKNHFC